MASEDQTAVPKDAPVPASTKEPSGFGISHTILVAVANFAIESFFKEIKIVGRENVPLDGAVILSVSLAWVRAGAGRRRAARPCSGGGLG